MARSTPALLAPPTHQNHPLLLPHPWPSAPSSSVTNNPQRLPFPQLSPLSPHHRFQTQLTATRPMMPLNRSSSRVNNPSSSNNKMSHQTTPFRWHNLDEL